MRVFPLFELFLVLFTFYAILQFEGGMRILVPILCLITVLLFEKMREKVTQKSRRDL